MDFREKIGHFPATLNDLERRSWPEGAHQNWWYKDGWQQPIVYTFTSNAFRLVSIGTDQKQETHDDIVYEAMWFGDTKYATEYCKWRRTEIIDGVTNVSGINPK